MMLKKLFVSAIRRNVSKVELEFIPQFINLINELFILAEHVYRVVLVCSSHLFLPH